jgi:hypothetical protein
LDEIQRRYEEVHRDYEYHRGIAERERRNGAEADSGGGDA